MKSLLVTGGCGFIGSNFIWHVRRNHPECRVANLDKLTYAGNPENLAGLPGGGYHFVHGDVRDGELVRRILDEDAIEGVAHFAAETHVDRSIVEPRPFLESNVEGTFTLLEALWERPGIRFIHVGTDEVYGDLGESGEFVEVSPLRPSSPYSATKAAADCLVMAYARTYGLQAVITRCSNNFGPFQFPEKLIPLMIRNALDDRPLPVYGDGLQVRDWLYVEDHCTAVWDALTRGRPGEVYNVGGDAERTNLALVREILRQLGKPESLIAFVKDRAGHDRRYALDASKFRQELGWRPEVAFEEGLARTIDWYRAHPEWLARASGR